ncbi:Uncharacterized protein FWK35_00033852, partial [Aphis craccivora]
MVSYFQTLAFIRSLVLGSSGCEQSKYKLLKRIIYDIDGVKIFTFFENDKVISPGKVLPNSIFIMDDVIGEHQQIKIKNNDDLNEKYQQEIEYRFYSIDLDKTYGLKKLSDGNIVLSDKEVKFIENYSYRRCYLFNNLGSNPTSAHLTLKSKKIKKSGSKYKDIIRKLFPTGGCLSMNLQKNNLVHWDNPNELVDRLRLLLSSKAAVNTGVSNEIILIFEELLEAEQIKRLPNADLVEMIPYSKKNKGYKYILCVIDCFTKFAWAV